MTAHRWWGACSQRVRDPRSRRKPENLCAVVSQTLPLEAGFISVRLSIRRKLFSLIRGKKGRIATGQAFAYDSGQTLEEKHPASWVLFEYPVQVPLFDLDHLAWVQAFCRSRVDFAPDQA